MITIPLILSLGLAFSFLALYILFAARSKAIWPILAPLTVGVSLIFMGATAAIVTWVVGG